MNATRRDVCAIRRTRRVLFYLCVLALGATGALLIAACTNVIRPPMHVEEPATVYLLDHGRTPSLVLPDGADGMIRYGYGDWDWYALDETGFLQAIAALGWPTQGALGRFEMYGPVDEASIRARVRIVIEQILALEVEREAVLRLRAKLDGIYAEQQSTLVSNEASQFEFVHHPEHYSALNNSSTVIASWLEELGAEVQGLALVSEWRVER